MSFEKIIDQLNDNKTMNENTKKIYISRIKKLKTLFSSPSELKKAEDLISALESSSLNTKLSYINTLIALKKYTDGFNIDLKSYQNIQIDLINERTDKLDEDIASKSVVPWSKLVALQEQFSSDYGSFNHLLVSLYTLIAPLRDDFGNVEFIIDNKDDNDQNNYYNLKTKTLILNDYKGVNYIRNKKDKKKKIKFPTKLHSIIESSLNLFPRDFLITKGRNKSISDIYYGGSLSGILRDITGYSINDFRHSYSSRNVVGKGVDFKQLKNDADGMSHSLTTHLTYFRGINN